MTDYFNTAFNKTMKIEGERELSNDSLDPGGQTFSGISRVYWPGWKGWSLIDNWLAGEEINWSIIDTLTRSFYQENFWYRIQGNKLADISVALACEVFDTSVNTGVHKAVKMMQEGYNSSNGYDKDLTVDGELGPKTLEALSTYFSSMPGSKELNEEILLNCINGEQYIFYKSNPKNKRFRGWFARL